MAKMTPQGPSELAYVNTSEDLQYKYVCLSVI